MNALELIRRRRSVRSFDGRSLSEEEIDEILHFANSVESPYELPVIWKVLSAKASGLSSPVITGTDTYIAGKMQRVPYAEEAFGYTFERVVLFAESRGIGTTWIGGTMDRGAFERAMNLEEGEVMPCVSPLGYPAKKMSLRETMMRKGVKADSRLPFEELFYDGCFDTPLHAEKAGEWADALEMVRWAPSAVNKQPWRVIVSRNTAHFYEKKSKGFIGANGWDMQKIDMGIALCHFAAGMEEKGKKVTFLLEDPGIAHPADTDYIASYQVV